MVRFRRLRCTLSAVELMLGAALGDITWQQLENILILI